jgi:hypothetical protein
MNAKPAPRFVKVPVAELPVRSYEADAAYRVTMDGVTLGWVYKKNRGGGRNWRGEYMAKLSEWHAIDATTRKEIGWSMSRRERSADWLTGENNYLLRSAQ